MFAADKTYTVGTLNSQVVVYDAPVQFISSIAGARYFLNVTVVTSVTNIWPRDCDASGGSALAGDYSNKDLGHNLNWTGLPNGGMAQMITDDPGEDLLAVAGFGTCEYCWLLDTTLVGLTAKAAAFAAGARNWHRRTNLPYAALDNLNIGTLYYVTLGFRDERNRRAAPNVVAGDYATTYGKNAAGGGGSRNIVARFHECST
jgi:hypothetical protein